MEQVTKSSKSSSSIPAMSKILCSKAEFVAGDLIMKCMVHTVCISKKVVVVNNILDKEASCNMEVSFNLDVLG